MAKKNRRHNSGESDQSGGSPPAHEVTEGKSDDDAKAGDSAAKEWTKSLLVAVVLFVVICIAIFKSFSFRLTIKLDDG